MTYHTKTMDDKVDRWGKPWVEGDLRVFHDDDREYWSVTPHWDVMYAVSWFAWYSYGGQMYHDHKWVNLKGGLADEQEPAAQDQTE